MKLLLEFLIMNGQKIMCLKLENVTWLDSLNCLAMPLRNFPEAFGFTAQKSRYSHLFNATENMQDVGRATDFSYYGVDELV